MLLLRDWINVFPPVQGSLMLTTLAGLIAILDFLSAILCLGNCCSIYKQNKKNNVQTMAGDAVHAQPGQSSRGWAIILLSSQDLWK